MFLIVVSLEERPCMTNGVEMWPAQAFLKRLWDGKVFDIESLYNYYEN